MLTKKKIYFLVLLSSLLIAVTLGNDQNSDQTCCQKMNFKSRCHFLCNDDDSSFWDQLACAKERINLIRCKTQEKIDLVKLYGDRFTDTVSNAWGKLSDSLKLKLASVKNFASITISELNGLHQDLLCSLNTLSGMTSSQFGGILYKLQGFTTENLEQFVSKVDIDVFYSRLSSLATYTWDKSQLATLAETAYKKYGPKVKDWSSQTLRNFGKIIAGFPTKVFSQFSEKALEESLDKICEASISAEKKLQMLPVIEKIFGQRNLWNSSTIERLCNVIEVLSPKEFLMLKAKEIEDSINNLSKRFLTPEQKESIIKRLKDRWGKVSQWSAANFKKTKNFVEGLSAEDFQDLNKEKIKELLVAGKVNLMNIVQQSALYKKILTEYGEPEDWPESILTQSIELVQSLSKDDLLKIRNKSRSSLIKALKYAKNVDWSRDQAEFLLNLLENENALATFTKDQIVELGHLIKVFSKSDAGKFSKRILYLAFPELVFVEGIGVPVLRHFVEVYRTESRNGEIKNLGQFAKALTRNELSQEDIKDILSNVKELSGTEFDEAQAAELMVKIRKALGDVKKSDHTDADILPWGFQNIRKIGKIILSLSRKEAEEFPFKGMNDTMEELGKQDGWKRRLVLAFIKRIKTSWKEQGITLQDLKEVNIEVLGKFVQGLTLTDLNGLSEDVKMMAIKKLGEYTGLPEDKLKSRANFGFKFFEKLRGGNLQSNDWKTMGNLLSGLSVDLINKILPEDIVENLEKLIDSASINKLEMLLRKVKQNFQQSDVAKWTSTQWNKALPLVRKLQTTIELTLMSNDVFKNMIAKLGKIKTWSKDQAEALLLKAKTAYGADISKWESKTIHQLGSIFSALSEKDILKMTKKFFDSLNSDLLENEKLSASLKKEMASQFVKEYLKDDISKLTVNVMKRFHFLLSGLNIEQLQKINIGDNDILDVISQHTDWNHEQLKVLAAKAKAYISSDLFEVAERSNYVRNLIRGYTVDDIKALADVGFKNFVGYFGSLTDLTTEQKKEIIKKAKNVWGDVSTWNDGQVVEVKNIIDGLEANDIKMIRPEAMNRVGEVSLRRLSDAQLQALKVDQVMELEETQIRAFTPSQRSKFNAPQLNALLSVENEDPKDADPYASASIQKAGDMWLMLASILAMLFIYTLY